MAFMLPSKEELDARHAQRLELAAFVAVVDRLKAKQLVEAVEQWLDAEMPHKTTTETAR